MGNPLRAWTEGVMKRERLRTNFSRIHPKNGDLGNMKIAKSKGVFLKTSLSHLKGQPSPGQGHRRSQRVLHPAHQRPKTHRIAPTKMQSAHLCALTLPTHAHSKKWPSLPKCGLVIPHAGKSHQGTIGGEQDRESEIRAGKIHAVQEEQPPGTAQCSEVGRDASPAVGTS